MPFSEKLEEFQNRLGLRFSRPELLLQALTHESFCRESRQNAESNERLEFLGDSVLGVIVSHYLYRQFPEAPEGMLAQMKSYLVSTEFLEQKAREISLGEFILLGKGEDLTGGRERASLLTDTYEALLGALYLDSGIQSVEEFVIAAFEPSLQSVAMGKKNAKSLLQEHTQKYFKCLPLYCVLKEEGPAHQKTFFVQVFFRGEILGEGSGSSKKEAEKVAADVALKNFKTYLEKEFLRKGRICED